jgi:hypothetical protein
VRSPRACEQKVRVAVRVPFCAHWNCRRNAVASVGERNDHTQIEEEEVTGGTRAQPRHL